MTPFWYILGYGYEVTVFKNKLVAEQALKDRKAEGDGSYWQLFEGKYGEEFSGWIGAARPDELG